jgi:hypothetical protein
MPRNIPNRQIYSVIRNKFKRNKAFQKGFLKRHDEELMKSDINYDLLALGLGRGCNLRNQNKYVVNAVDYRKILKKW